ncbi:sialate O-acetylesterase [Paraflavitalea devenefica]|uniref:sialate O-acetylesterase n=1 Tax=Paraflavitalea devenefica TaxID=2716334 RepID=UPI001FE76759|nr:sialate O-acetylesterase [Paraflavitalea devenefica]
MIRNSKSLFLVAFLLVHAIVKAEVQPNSLFSDHMVLQRDIAVPVWGTASEGEKVTVTFNDQQVSATAVNGKWMVKLNPLKAGGPFVMAIAGTNTITINDIQVGEVWLCGGQSNMERHLGLQGGQKPIINWEAEAAAANYPLIRQFYLPRVGGSAEPLASVNANWTVCTPGSVKGFSAVGYFFARDLFNELKVPIGIIHSSWGGTPAEKWTSRETLAGNPALKELVDAYNRSISDYPARLENYKKNEPALLEKWAADTLLARQAGKSLPRKPSAPVHPVKAGDCGGLYNSMIAPLIPYAIKGVCWYQGEANNTRAKQYQTLLPVMINSWRSAWNEGDFPFLIVQIAPYKDMKPEIREAQLLITQQTRNTALIVTTDCGDSSDIHPANKQPVGARLALAARALAYKQRLEYSGPVYASMKKQGDKIVLRFTHGKGLAAKGEVLKGFSIAGADQQFVPATATIKGKKIIVFNDTVKDPVAVRYGWANVPDVNLYNSDALPASPFRTDVE